MECSCSTKNGTSSRSRSSPHNCARWSPAASTRTGQPHQVFEAVKLLLRGAIARRPQWRPVRATASTVRFEPCVLPGWLFFAGFDRPASGKPSYNDFVPAPVPTANQRIAEGKGRRATVPRQSHVDLHPKDRAFDPRSEEHTSE